ncbi:MAG: hypothetical protein NTX79_08210 [Candidatus Micrarchaeota archaeon]|nr:hypothetical protein [Candidatus Micrarchaeota archaeon]
MVNEYDLLERLVIGALVLLGIALALAVFGLVVLIALPFAIGYAIAKILFWLYGGIRHCFFPAEIKEPTEFERNFAEMQLEFAKKQREKKRLADEKEARRLKLERTPETALDSDWKEPEKEYELSGNLHLSSSLTNRQRNELYTLGYNVIKISPFGTSGAAVYWVKTRHNESKEHAFFCYILEAELRKYTDDIRMNATNGPDLVVNWKGKQFCFDVETGKSLSRQPDWLESKFAYYQREYDRSFILVTKRTLKYKYSRYGDVITRGKIKETLRQLFRRR